MVFFFFFMFGASSLCCACNLFPFYLCQRNLEELAIYEPQDTDNKLVTF